MVDARVIFKSFTYLYVKSRIAKRMDSCKFDIKSNQRQMKKENVLRPFFTMIILSLSLSMITTSCSKDDDKSEPTSSGTENNEDDDETLTVPSFAEGKGTLVAIKSINTTSTPLGPLVTTIGTAVAVFYESVATDSFIDAGEVKAEEQTLTKNENFSYVFKPQASQPKGIDYSSENVHWEVSGMGSTPAIDETTTMGFPTVGDISSPGTVKLSDGYTLTVPSIDGADSVLFLVGKVVRTAKGSLTSYTFSANDLSNLSTGTNLVQVAAYKIEDRATDGKIYHFVNETIKSKTVTIE